MIVLESNNPEESKIGSFAYVLKNRVNSENWKLVCEHLNILEISKEDTMYLPLIAILQISVSNGPKYTIHVYDDMCYDYAKGIENGQKQGKQCSLSNKI